MSDQKDTIYIDIDDEITAIIDKVVTSKKAIVALVLPKRATVLQSVVNMRLLKRAADEAGKSLVLVTSEASVLPLAGAVGLYISKTLQSKPYIPEGAGAAIAGDSEDGDDSSDEPIDPTKPVGELAGDADSDDETIELDDLPEEKLAATGAPAAKTKKSKKPKKN